MQEEDFVRAALSVSGASQSSHFGKRDFRIQNRIFATLPGEEVAVLKLTIDQQAMAESLYPNWVSPVPKAWGAKGWTRLHLPSARLDAATHLLALAAGNVEKTAAKSGP